MNAKSAISTSLLIAWLVSGANAALKIDFTQTGGPVEPGWQAYYADHESVSTFTEQQYVAFGTTISVKSIWQKQPAQQAMQMIERSSGSSLIIDWIGTDARVANGDPLVLVIGGLPAGRYLWTSWHHDVQDQTGLFDVMVADANGLSTATGIDISTGAMPSEGMTRFETTIVSDGMGLVAISFDCRNHTKTTEAFFVMNALTLESWDASDPPVVEDPNVLSAVVINEFVASNRRSLDDGDANSSDWVELYNGGAAPVSLNGWSLTDKQDNLQKWFFPPATVLPAGGYLIVFASGQATDDYVDKGGYLHTNFALSRGGEYLALVDPGGEVVHEYAPAYPPQETDISYGMWGDEHRYFVLPTPGRANQRPVLGLVGRTYHSHDRGFYDEPFDLWILCNTPDASIRYTLDGSEPTEQYGILYNREAPIPITTTTHVRSVAYKAGWKTADVTTHSYIFVDDVARQESNPPGWPTDWGYDSEVGGLVPADYEMDPRVVDDTQPGYSVREALLDIPTVSLSMLPDDFISSETGIYANPRSRWERKCSIEYILPDGAEGFQHDCKVEVHGNSSRRPWRMQKHSLRLTFTSQYGPAKLEYPLFPESDVDEYNQLVLRASFTDSWGLVSWSSSRYRPNDSQYIRDVWMKESLRDMGQPSSLGHFVHLYVNGLYFGIFNLTERVGADFFADHLGGEPEHWEINEDLSRQGSHWRAMMSIDLSASGGYARMQEYLDLENFADYMLLHFYADAEDWPHHNGYAAANPISGDGQYRFFVWDQEIVLDYHGRATSRIDSGGGAGDLFQKMRASEEFRMLFADRVYKHCFNDGALSVTASQDRYLEIANWIDKAIVAESARWGDTQMSTPYGNSIQQPNPLNNINHDLYPPVPHGPDYYLTREDSWVVERDNILENYIRAIHDTSNSYALINVLRSKGLYPDIDPPEFHINGTYQHGGPISSGDVLTMINPNGRGAIYYTLDGTDPRPPGVVLPQDEANVLVPEDAAKRVLVPTGEISPSWRGGAPYGDTSWTSGTGGVGYERSSGYGPLFDINVGTQMYNVNGSCYIRIPFAFTAEDSNDLAGLTLQVRYDDGFVAYVNGVEVARDRFTGTPQWNSVANGSHSDPEAMQFADFNITAHAELLQEGDNLLAIHGLNASTTSSDFLISVKIVMSKAAPEPDPSELPAAAQYTRAIPLTAETHVKARVLDNGRWSALHEATYEVGPQ